MGCHLTKHKPRVANHYASSLKQSLKTQKSKVDELRSEVLENGLNNNEDGYYDEEELKLIDPESILKLIDSHVEEPKHFKWQLGHPIGHGSFGRVFTALNHKTGQLMAVKQIQISGASSEERLGALEIEIELLALLKHKNIVSYYGMQRDNNEVHIFLEYVAGGSLSQMIKKFGRFNENIIRVYIKQILQGLQYLHSNGVMHCDIKGGNVLVDINGVCKLADFGSSRRIKTITGQATSLFGTPNFMAPEIIRQVSYGRKADIWSLGCTFIELSTGKPPWHDLPNQYAIMIRISKGEIPQIPETLSEEAKDFISHCLELDQKKRWNALKLLKHPFIVKDNSQIKTPIARTPLKTPNAKKNRQFNYPPNQNELATREGGSPLPKPLVPSTKVIEIHHSPILKPPDPVWLSPKVEAIDLEQELASNFNPHGQGSKYEKSEKSDFELGSMDSSSNNKNLVNYLLSENSKTQPQPPPPPHAKGDQNESPRMFKKKLVPSPFKDDPWISEG